MKIIRVFGYQIILTKITRIDDEIPVDDRIYITKEMAKARIIELCQEILAHNPKMAIKDYWDTDESFRVKYDSCKNCPEYDLEDPCVGECYQPIFELSIDQRQYDIVTDLEGDSCAVYCGKD